MKNLGFNRIRLLFVTTGLFLGLFIKAQTIYITSESVYSYLVWSPIFNTFLPYNELRAQLYSVNLATCTKTLLLPIANATLAGNPVNFTDIAISASDPNTLYGVGGRGALAPLDSYIYRIDISTNPATVTLINSNFSTLFPPPFPSTTNRTLVALVADNSGNLYAAESTHAGGLYRYNIATNTWTNLGSFGNYNANGDLTYFGGNLVLTTTTNELLSINQTTLATSVLSTMNVPNMYGAVTVSTGTGCLAVTSLVGSAGQSLYTVNATTGNCTALCSNLLPVGEVMNGAATIAESSNPIPVNVLGAVSIPTVCSGSPTTLSASGADTYSWNPGGAGASISVNPTTTTTYTVTGTNTTTGCTGTTTVLVTVNNNPSVTASTASPTICSGGSSTLTAGGAGSYVWNPGNLSGGSVSVSPGSTTTYTVTGTTSGCSSTSTVAVTVNNNPSVTASTASPTICSGGSSTLTAGGAGSYVWNPGNLSGGSVSVSPGSTTTYTVTGTTSGCSSTSTVAVTVNNNPSVTASTASPTICSGGSATLNAGGAGSYVWNPGNLIGGSVSVSPGSTTTYTVTGTTSGCSSTSTVVVTVNNNPSVTASTASPTICSGGSATLNAGGAGSYVWNPGNLSGGSVSVSPGSSTTYTVTGTTSGCSSTSTVLVNVNTTPNVTASATAAAICSGGSATLNAGGAGSYVWNPGNLSGGSVSVSPGSSTTYTVTGTTSGCSSTSTVTVGFNNNPSVGAVASSYTLCGSASTNLTGTGASTYNWNPGNLSGTTVNVTPSSGTTYTVVGTDGNGCSATSTITINKSATALSSSINVNSNVTCNGLSNGALTANAAGGTGAYTYLWNTTSGLQSIGTLTIGDYTVTITDGYGCTSVSNTSITQPSIIGGTFSSSAATCGNSNGSLTVSGTGGLGGYTYVWDNGSTNAVRNGLVSGTYTVTVTDGSGCARSTTSVVSNSGGATISSLIGGGIGCYGANSGTASVTASGGFGALTYTWSPSGGSGTTATGLTAAIYTVEVRDANNCLTSSTVSISQPNEIIISNAANTSATCGSNNGSASISITGGTGAYTFLWSNGSTSNTANGLAVGPHTVTVTDGNTCSKTHTVNISSGGGLNVSSFTNVSPKCNGSSDGTATITIAAGTSPLTYSWSSGSPVITSAMAYQVTGITQGSYTLTVTDANGCQSISTVNITEPSIINATLTATNANCGASDGSIFANASGGTGAYTYLWNNSANGATAGGLASGNYVVTITDGNACTRTFSQVVGNIGGATVTSINGVDAKCNGDNSGSASVIASGGFGALTYTWTPSGGSAATATGLTAGIYTVNIRDANNCLTSSTVSVSEVASIVPVLQSTPATCNVNNGSAFVVSVSGGTAPYNYSWSNAATGATASGLGANTYIITITDNNLCVQTATVSVANGGSASVNTAGTATICSGQSTLINATPVGGTGPYTYSWSNGLNGPGPHTVSPSTTTLYTVSIEDATGCITSISTITVTINPPLALSLSASGGITTLCNGVTATLNASASDGNGGPYNYTWMPNNSTGATANVSPTSTTTYTVTVTDNCSAPITQTITINVSSSFPIDIQSSPTASCVKPLCVQFTGITSANCVSSVWTFGDGGTSSSSSTNHCFVNDGIYDVTYTCTDASGCISSKTVNGMVKVHPTPKVDFAINTTLPTEDKPVEFTDLTVGANTLQWNFGDPASDTNNTSTLANPTHTYADSGNYCVKLLATSVNGCVDSTVKCLYVDLKCILPDSIPNVFSPNNDNKNDIFIMKAQSLKDLTCSIFNRWGVKLYEYNAIKSGWDGRTFTDAIAPDGVYYYLLDATCKDGVTTKQGQGFLHLVR